MTEPKTLALGATVMTVTAQDRLTYQDMINGLNRHRFCDWGDCCDEDRASNDWSYEHGGRIMSVYTATSGEKFWIITEADRSSTCILMPEDY